MKKSVMEKINQVILMPGMRHVDILPEANQVWFLVQGKNETFDVVTILEEMFSVSANNYSECETFKKDNRFNFTMSVEDLIITVNGIAKEEAPAVTEAPMEIIQLDCTIDDMSWTVEEIMRNEA